ncbi:NAD(P)/FAD-dependent oxidoreductase [candidate division TA06 bacterium]|nr:NAD(P)/FAD-dependent oxidoreductase [candidate division TA06 bacterium]
MKPYDLIIIGGGPAGIGAALQAGREGRKVLLAEKDILGGRLNHAFWVKNFPLAGPEGSSGKTIVRGLVKQLKSLDIGTIQGTCQAIDHKGVCFVSLINDHLYNSRSVVMAGGLEPKKLLVPGAGKAFEQKRLVYYWDDIPGQLKDKSIAVIGGGEVALDQACSLAAKGAKATVLVRGDKVKAYPGLIKMAEGLGVKIKYGSIIDRISLNGQELVLHGSENRNIKCDRAVVAIGSSVPGTIIYSQAKKLLNKGLYLAGDLANKDHKQAAIAFGSGVQAAMLADLTLYPSPNTSTGSATLGEGRVKRSK